MRGIAVAAAWRPARPGADIGPIPRSGSPADRDRPRRRSAESLPGGRADLNMVEELLGAANHVFIFERGRRSRFDRAGSAGPRAVAAQVGRAVAWSAAASPRRSLARRLLRRWSIARRPPAGIGGIGAGSSDRRVTRVSTSAAGAGLTGIGSVAATFSLRFRGLG